MSKRFGRNQKRKLREALTQAEEKLREKSKEISYLNKLNEDNAYAVCLTEEILGEYFAGLPPKTLDLSQEQNYLNLSLISKPKELYDFSPKVNVQDLTRKILMLDTVKMEVYLDDLRKSVVVQGGMPNGPYVAMSFDAMRNLPSHAIEEMLRYNFIPHLVKEIKRHIDAKKSKKS